MIKNKLREKWAAGQGTINGWLSINSPFVAEIMAEQGYDSVTIDMQHGAVSYEGALGMLQAMRASATCAIPRTANAVLAPHARISPQAQAMRPRQTMKSCVWR